MTDQTPSAASKPRRRVIRELDARYVVPADVDPIRVLLVRQEPDGAGANFHYVYVTLCEEIDPDA